MVATVEARMPAGTQHFACAEGERLLYAGIRAGVNLAYGCATGTCGDCRANLIEGRVESAWPQAPGTRALRRPGEILLCQSIARGDCIIEARTDDCSHQRERGTNQRAVVVRVIPSAEGLTWIELELQRPMRFHAGQFVLVGVEGIEGWRAYSPATAGDDATRLALVVREKSGGALSPLLCATSAIGREVDVFGPLGTAHVRPKQDADLAIVVGGSGAAVALSVLDWASRSGHFERHRVDVVCGLRSCACPQVLDRFTAAAKQGGDRLRIVVALSEDSKVPGDFPSSIQFASGLAHDAAAGILAPPEWQQRSVFVAGPPPMVAATTRMLMRHARLNPACIRYDSFS
jgi:toluene monooxygenase electron transfer component